MSTIVCDYCFKRVDYDFTESLETTTGAEKWCWHCIQKNHHCFDSDVKSLRFLNGPGGVDGDDEDF